MNEPTNDFDAFAHDILEDGEQQLHAAVGYWGVSLLHTMKAAFVIYSGAHNIQAALSATGSSTFAVVAQIVGVLVLEATITALYMAGVAGRITGRLQSVIAAFFWLVGMTFASAGIVADSRLHAGYELGPFLNWYITAGLFIAPVIMVIGTVLVVFTDPVLGQKIANSRDRATIQREKVKTAVLAEQATHQTRRIVHNIRLAAQKQMAIEARSYYKSDEVQAALRETATEALQDVMRQAGIHLAPGRQVSPTHEAYEAQVSRNGDVPRPFVEETAG